MTKERIFKTKEKLYRVSACVIIQSGPISAIITHISFWKWKKSAIERIDDLITEVDQIRGKFGNGDLNSSVLTIDLSNVGTTPVQPTGLTPNNSFQDLKGNYGFDLILIHWCWRRNLLVTTLRCCRQFSSLLTPKSSGATTSQKWHQ